MRDMIFYRYNMHEGVDNHLTLKAPSLKVGGLPIMLTAPYGVYWTEITPQDLVGESIIIFRII